MANAVEGDTFIGRRVEELRGLLKIKYPIEHGIVTDWDDMERIWQHIYSEELKAMPEEVGLRERSVSSYGIGTDDFAQLDTSIQYY
jgi:actin-related protein